MSGHSTVRVVVVGAGFGGLEAAKSLARLPFQITVVDRKNYLSTIALPDCDGRAVTGGNCRSHSLNRGQA
jgi:2-polyprenyl-6-methoxyphenol hydroxylase-like FAD-dependent oxidoreductase